MTDKPNYSLKEMVKFSKGLKCWKKCIEICKEKNLKQLN